jgi:2-polyprenyl-6-methoxyphenol hydroxylase-like FAD-dependent oxidoreductase
VPKIVIVGGSVIGSTAALLLARDGCEVVVLDKDAAPPPSDPRSAWDEWERTAVPQFRQPHNLFPRVRLILESELPDVVDRLAAAGLYRWSYLDSLPPSISDRTSRPGDDRFWCYTGRRPVFEAVLAAALLREPNVIVRRGARVAGLLTSPSVVDGVPNAAGVRLDSGEELRADLVVDATGRRTQLADWLELAGGRRPSEEAEDSGFTYYTRFFAGPALPVQLAPAVTPMGTVSLLTLPGDNDTWSVTLFCASNDRPLKRLRLVDAFTDVVRAFPRHAHWLDGTPITDIVAMSGVLDKYRRFVVDGAPVATGLRPRRHEWACTKPSEGLGICYLKIHAQAIRDVGR